ncbi:MAG: T9SS type A sorting domain-containing protein [Melioribacteraceae bacterium]|nr:T9SS type A sorting domain-containing protein [Melioribacteraceae bacterium]MCF8355812.1 T9SS type A sorting domain-containing protein [Melioribacteraceae bacterium]MCF8395302.1 T9SS type A sorting domain-containing protein [Melioribacteraceae bacterium]MCF8420750.1 T9SS type A sorting domain-containing protein [Melioribacteraceae bacterium]
MIKQLLHLLIILISTNIFYAQSASDYFPSETGYEWYYNVTPLDSAGNPVEELEYAKVDSFAAVGDYFSKTSNLIITKTGPHFIIDTVSFFDTLFTSFGNDSVYLYISPLSIDTTGLVDSTGIELDTLYEDIFELAESLKGWYNTFNFDSAVDDDYQVFQLDTTITFDSTELPLRFQIEGLRNPDETITTEYGTFDCKKFTLNAGIYYLVEIFPGVILPIEIVEIPNYFWIAEDIWIVKEFRPTVTSLTIEGLDLPVITVPGQITERINKPTSVNNERTIAENYYLKQNYPNPFNPSTNIEYRIEKSGFVKLEIYDALGRLVVSLQNGIQNAGNYIVNFNAKNHNLTSGIYLYRLQIERRSEVRKMILIK